MHDLDEYESLVDINEEEFKQKYASIIADMINKKSWYVLDGLYKGSGIIDYSNYKFYKIETHKYLGLGRSTYYDKFLEELSAAHKHKVFQSDYMVWIKPSNPYESLLFYIDTADSIDFSLEGLSLSDIELCTKFGRATEDRHELGSRYMTLWEMNQILFSDNLGKTKWHIRDNLKIVEVYKSFSNIVELDNIISKFD